MNQAIRKYTLFTIIAALGFLILLTAACKRNDRYAQFGGYAQGGTWGVKANLAGVKTSRAEIQRSIEAILEEIDTTLSGYNKSSQLSRLNAGDTIRPNAMLCEVYAAAWKFWQESDGALDCAAGPIYNIWGFGFKSGEMPTDEQVQQALAISGMKLLLPTMEEAMRDDLLCGSWLLHGRGCCGTPCSGGRADSNFGRSSLTDDGGGATDCRAPGCIETRVQGAKCGRDSCDGGRAIRPQLNFNAIAQGYSCDRVAAYLDGIGVKDMLVDIGEIWCRGLNPSGKPWRVGVDRPVDGNDRPGADMDGIWESGGLGSDYGAGGMADGGSDFGCGGIACGQGIVTSGNYRKFYIRDGRKYSHTIDPRSGYPVGTAPSVKTGVPSLKTDQNRDGNGQTGVPSLKTDQNRDGNVQTGVPSLKTDQNRDGNGQTGVPSLKTDQNRDGDGQTGVPSLKSGQNRDGERSATAEAGTLLSATIVAPTAMAADAYATYCMVIGFEAARDFIESRPDLEGYLIFSIGATVTADGSCSAANTSDSGNTSTGDSSNTATGSSGNTPTGNTGNTSTGKSGNTSTSSSDMSEWASSGFKLSH